MGENRDLTYDIMKGIGILLMLVGHWPGLPHWTHQFIYSFHMPLFFLVAGCFAKPINGDAISRIRKNARRLLLPFVVTQILLVLWGGIQTWAKHDVSYVIKPGLSLVWGGCDVIDSRWGLVYVGPMWFLPALFWGKTAFEFLLSKMHKWVLMAVCTAISVVSIVLHKYTNSPWCILQGLSCLTFMSIGYMAKNNQFPKWVYWMALACWSLAIFLSSMEVATCYYQIYPLDVMGACGGTLFVWWLSGLMKKSMVLSKPIVWLGVNSLVVLCFHNFEWFSAIAYSVASHIPIDIQGDWMTLFRYLLAFVFVIVAVKLPYFSDVYVTRKNRINVEKVC